MSEHDRVLEQWNFKHVKIGELEHPLDSNDVGSARVSYRRVRACVPGRLFCLFKNIKGLVLQETTGEFNYGEVSFGVNLLTHADVALADTLTITPATRRPSIVRHAAEITRKQIKYDGGFSIDANNDFVYHHVGSGSSAALYTATALAINRLLGDPIKQDKIPFLIARNYGEEIEGDSENLITVQCTGGTSWMGLVGGVIMVDESRLLQRIDIPDELGYIIGVPDYSKPDAKGAMAREAGAIFKDIMERLPEMDPFHKRIFHEVGIAMQAKDIIKAGRAIYDAFSYDPFMQLFENMFPGIKAMFWKLRDLTSPYAPIATFISSAGPSIVTLCEKDKRIQITKCYQQIGIDYTFAAQPANSGVTFEILEK